MHRKTNNGGNAKAMQLNSSARTVILPLLSKLGYLIINEGTNRFKFQSSLLELVISHNAFDKTNLLQIGRIGGRFVTISDSSLCEVFHANYKVERVSLNVLIKNVALWIENEGKTLLEGNLKLLDELFAYESVMSKNYTDALIAKQQLESIDKAWERHDYKLFVMLVEDFPLKRMPASYQLKYQIASREINT